MTWLRQSTSINVKIGPFVDETDGKTALTGLSITQGDVRLSKQGADFAQKASTAACVHDELGYYDCTLSSADTATAGVLTLVVHEATALPVWHEFMVVPAQVWDSLFGVDRLQVHAAEITNGLIVAATFGAEALSAAALAADAVAEIADGVWDEALSGHTATGSAGKKLGDQANAADPWSTALPGAYGTGTAGKILGDKAFNANQIGGSAAAATNAARGYQGLVLGKAITGTLTTTAFTTDLSETTNDHYNGRILTFTSGPLAGQQTTILDYNGTTKVLTVQAMTEAPANNNEFFIS
jgi:hypothetical protein